MKNRTKKQLTVLDGVVLSAGVVISVGIFKTPSIVAANSGNESIMLLLWIAGGLFSLIGALCYAELSAAYPHAGGDYHYLIRAYGKYAGFLFAWARMTVIQTGSIAVFAFIIGDYATAIMNLGEFSSSYYAGLTVIILTLINIAGVRRGMRVQTVLLFSILAGLIFISILGIANKAPEVHSIQSLPTWAGLGTAMIFVLFTYGGWQEVVYLSAEMGNPGRNMVRSLLYSIGLITAVYLIINYAYLRSMGFESLRGTEIVAADMIRASLGENGARFISLLIVIAALSTINGIVITGARTNYALGKDFAQFEFLGRLKGEKETPVNAFMIQAAISLILIFIGSISNRGFTMMVEYTAPVFWLFFLLVGIALFVLRKKEVNTHRPFRVPFYPVTPILFCLISLYMLKSSLAYTGTGALIGVGVLLLGVPLMFVKKSSRAGEQDHEKKLG